MAPNEPRGFGDWTRDGNTLTITYAGYEGTIPETRWTCAAWSDTNCATSNDASWQKDEEHRERVKAFWSEMRRPRRWWLAVATQTRFAPHRSVIPAILIPCAQSVRKPSGRRYGGLKHALRRL